jgi:hypothetical protein
MSVPKWNKLLHARDEALGAKVQATLEQAFLTTHKEITESQ